VDGTGRSPVGRTHPGLGFWFPRFKVDDNVGRELHIRAAEDEPAALMEPAMQEHGYFIDLDQSGIRQGARLLVCHGPFLLNGVWEYSKERAGSKETPGPPEGGGTLLLVRIRFYSAVNPGALGSCSHPRSA